MMHHRHRGREVVRRERGEGGDGAAGGPYGILHYTILFYNIL